MDKKEKMIQLRNESQLKSLSVINLKEKNDSKLQLEPTMLSRARNCTKYQDTKSVKICIKIFLSILSFLLLTSLHVNGHSWPPKVSNRQVSNPASPLNRKYQSSEQVSNKEVSNMEVSNLESIDTSSIPVRGFHVQDHLYQDVQGIISVFTTSNSSVNFTHITIDPISGKVFVGATNWIFQLTSNLNPESSIRTGPLLDSPSCSPSDCSGLTSGLNGQSVNDGMDVDTFKSDQATSTIIDRSDLKMTKNVNKVLVIDPSSRMLIVCGSVYQGSCRRHSLSDVRQAEPLIGVPVAANDENSSTIAFIGKANYGHASSESINSGSQSIKFGPRSESMNFGKNSESINSGSEGNNQGHNVLFTAVTNTRLGPYRDVVPAISSRSLESHSLFSIIEDSFTDSARVDISYHLRDYFIVKYVTGFQSNNFVYFATVQPKSPFRSLEEWGSVSRLARICSSDAGYHSYTEMTIQCRGPKVSRSFGQHSGHFDTSGRNFDTSDEDWIDYNLLQSGTVLKVGSKLSTNLGLREGSEVFIGTFSVGKDHSSNPDGSRSAICLFPMEEIERHFMANIHLCYNGSVSSRNMDYIAGSVNECPEPRKYGNVGNFCNEAMKLNGSLPLSTVPIITYNDTTLSAVTATNMDNGHSIAIVGTSDGRVKKILISNSEGGKEMEQVTVDAGHPILQDIHLDQSKKFIYAASPYKVVKIRLDDIQGTSRHHHRNHHNKHHSNNPVHHHNGHRVQGESSENVPMNPRSGSVPIVPSDENHGDGSKVLTNGNNQQSDKSINRSPSVPSANERRKPVESSGQRTPIRNQQSEEEDQSTNESIKNDSPGQESLLRSQNHILAAIGLGFLLVLILVSITGIITKKNTCRSSSFRTSRSPSGQVPPLPLVKPLPLIPMIGLDTDSSSDHKSDHQSCDQFTYSDNNVYCEPTSVMVPNGNGHQVTRVDTRVDTSAKNKNFPPTTNYTSSSGTSANYSTNYNSGSNYTSSNYKSSNYLPNSNQSSSNQSSSKEPPPLYPPFITFNMIASHRDKSIPFIQTMGRRSGGQGSVGSSWSRPSIDTRTDQNRPNLIHSPSGTMNPLSTLLIDNPIVERVTFGDRVSKFQASPKGSSNCTKGSSNSTKISSNASYSYSNGPHHSSSGRDRFV